MRRWRLDAASLIVVSSALRNVVLRVERGGDDRREDDDIIDTRVICKALTYIRLEPMLRKSVPRREPRRSRGRRPIVARWVPPRSKGEKGTI
jgi:hypothetical protein